MTYQDITGTMDSLIQLPECVELTHIIVAGVAVFAMAVLWFKNQLPNNVPPSPMKPYPIVGHLPHLQKNPEQQFRDWRKKCGDLFSLQFGSKFFVVANGLKTIKECLVKHGDCLSDRPKSILEMKEFDNCGVVFSSGPNWKIQRKTSVTILRELGFGKNSLAEKIQEETELYLETLLLLSTKADSVDLKHATKLTVCNNICSMLLGQRFEYDDKEFKHMLECQDTLMEKTATVTLVHFLPMLQYFPGNLFHYKTVKRLYKETIHSYIKEWVLEILKTPPEERLDSYVSKYLKMKDINSPSELDPNVVKNTYDIFVAGSDTTSNTILWCILYLLHYPEIQEKIYNEIKSEIGVNRRPTINDVSRLPYLNAVILETQRLCSVVPLSITHFCCKDVYVNGYLIPKGASLIPNLSSVLHDEPIWKDGMTFQPERFLNDENKVTIPDEFTPFSMGNRICIGDSLAKMELFIILSNLFQSFQILSAGETLPSLEPKFGLTLVAEDYRVRLIKR